jgi:hypothetical protein
VGRASRLSGGRLALGFGNAGETPGAAGETPAPLPEQLPRKQGLLGVLARAQRSGGGGLAALARNRRIMASSASGALPLAVYSPSTNFEVTNVL